MSPHGPSNEGGCFYRFPIEVKEADIAHMRMGDSPECYVYIAKGLAYKPSQDSQDWVSKFFFT